ncbi:MAG: DNA polymerase III subunit gamma/tau [Planctomycetota bacterium]|nr:DNA polymerase III subunit gamma/tau [Planctomycetota bacterium]
MAQQTELLAGISDESPPAPGENMDSDPNKPENYTVIARRFRPQTFSELVGQERVADALRAAIQSNRVGHAFLFTGARGTGKTTTARIMAKALNCVTGPTTTPCNQCDICHSISEGQDIDALEIDAASNTGVDNIRELRQNANVRPSRSRFKIYIIDEVHMLSNAAFNALLKTLEEPPEHVKFIFCTTEADKLPITILSRCQRFDFANVQADKIISSLQEIARREGVNITEDALQVVARRAGGSVRDSQSLLEQLLAFGGEKIDAADVHRMLGTAGFARMTALANHIAQRNTGAALAEVDAAIQEGVDVGQLLAQLIGHFRDLMVTLAGVGPEGLLYNPAADHAALKATARELGMETMLAMMQIVDQTLSRLRYSMHGRTLAELAIVRICTLDRLESIITLLEQARSGVTTPPQGQSAAKKKLERLADNSSPATDHSGNSYNSDSDSSNASDSSEDPNLADASEAIFSELNATDGGSTDTDFANLLGEPESSASAHSASPPPDLATLDLMAIWQQVLSEMNNMTGEMAGRASSVAIRAPNQLVIEFPARYNFAKLHCERPEHAAELESALHQATGHKVKLHFTLRDKDQDPPGEAKPERAAPAPRRKVNDRAGHPLVQRATELFQARVVHVEETESS